MMPFRPLLAATVDDDNVDKLQYPLLGSPKLDGIRVTCHHELGPITRSGKPVPNKYVREVLSHPALKRLDGEVLVGDITAPDVFNRTQSAVMSFDGQPPFVYAIFDHYGELNLNCPFSLRVMDYAEQVEHAQKAQVPCTLIALKQVHLSNREELEAYEEEQVALGYEGIMLRSLTGKYKQNRSTFREQILMKVKRYVDAEGKIIGWEPLYRNENEAYIDERGYQRRSSHQDGKVADYSMVGKFILEVLNGRFKGETVKCGSGMNDEQRTNYARLFNEFDKSGGKTSPLYGQHVTFKYQDHGSKEKPRQPIFKGLRYDV